MKTITEIKALSDKDLMVFVAEQRAEVQKHRFGLGGRDVKASRTAKTAIAQAMTERTNRRSNPLT